MCPGGVRGHFRVGSFWDSAGALSCWGWSPRCSKALPQSEGGCWVPFQHCVSTPDTDFPCPVPCLPCLCLTQWVFPSFLLG